MTEEKMTLIASSDVERLKNIARHTAEFIANFEIAEKKMDEWEQRLYLQEERVQQQIAAVHAVANEFQSIMTEAGAARWRLSAEQALSLGQGHIDTLKQLSEDQLKRQQERNQQFLLLAKKTFERLDRASEHVINKINLAVDGFNPTAIKHVADKNREVLELTSTKAINKMQQLHQRFHWKGFVLAAAISLVASVTFGLYVNDELPWEMHKQVALQRSAGQALIKAWPTLSEVDREQILQHTDEAFT